MIMLISYLELPSDIDLPLKWGRNPLTIGIKLTLGRVANLTSCLSSRLSSASGVACHKGIPEETYARC